METIGAFEARRHLSSLLDRVANGERITITRHGVPAAPLVPVGQEEEMLSPRKSSRACGNFASASIPAS